MRDIDSDALSQVQRQLGISGVGSGVAVLEDDELRQVLDVGPAVRRGRADVANGGWFWGTLFNTHGAGNFQTSFINPYEADGFELTSYPAIVDVSRFDLWIAGATLRRTGGLSTIVSAALILGAPLRSLAFGKNQAGGTYVPTGGGFAVASWGTTVQLSTTFDFMIGQNGNPFTPLNMRMPRGSNLVFDSVSVGASNYELSILMGLFPIALGNDVLG